MSAELPVVAMDEAGNTGENLLDADQPVYALGAVHLDADHASQLVAEAAAKTQAPELKFATLRKTPAGRAVLLDALTAAGFDDSSARISVIHKPFMRIAKMVDVLIEPRQLTRGRQMAWYAGGIHMAMTELLYGRAPAALGETWPKLQRAFVAMVRDYRDETVDAYLEAMREAKLRCRPPMLHRVLSDMLDTRAELDDDVAGYADALDPAPPSLFWQAGAWSEQLAEFALIHDEANVVRRWAAHLMAASNPAITPTTLTVGEIELKLPHTVAGITFARSHDDHRVQLADLLAGAGAWLYAAAAGLRETDELARALAERGFGVLIEHFVGPGLPEAGVRLLSPPG